jgi:nucleotide-binding universal stress UspA family protein
MALARNRKALEGSRVPYDAGVTAPEPVLDRPFARVLVAVDGSERANEAVRQATRLAAASGAELVVAHVIAAGQREGEGDRILDAAIGVARARGIDPKTFLLTGDVAEALVEHAEGHDVDLVCVGPDSGLLGGAIRFGRVAGRVLREAPCSVLIARPAGDRFPERIACAIDGSETSVRTASVAAVLADATDAELRLVHVVPVFKGQGDEWTLSDEEASPPELEPSVMAATAVGVVPVREMAMGRPERVLISVAGRDDVDLVVVGHRGISGLQRRLLGSVSEHVAHHAGCSVLVVRGIDADAT